MVDVNTMHPINNGRGTSLMLASANGNVGIVCELLKHNQVKLNAADSRGNTALILATQAGHAEVVCELLKDKRTKVNAKTTRH